MMLKSIKDLTIEDIENICGTMESCHGCRLLIIINGKQITCDCLRSLYDFLQSKIEVIDKHGH